MAFRDFVGAAVVAAVVSAATTLALQYGILQRPAIEVPSVLALPVQSARGLAENRGLMFVVTEEREDVRAAPGSVLAQRPMEGSRIERGHTLEVVVAKAPAPVKVPAVAGLPFSEARSRLESARLAVGKLTEQPSADVKAGSVIAQNPAEASEVRLGSAVDLVMSKGAATLAVPSVVGRSLSKAKEELQKSGFTVGNLRYRADDDHSDGLILEQSPGANQQAPKGSAVDLIINRT